MKFPYSVLASSQSEAESMPRVPIQLSSKSAVMDTVALVDSGAMVNVLPFQTGLDLGFRFDEQKATLRLGGALGQSPAMVIKLTAVISPLPECILAFAWVKATLPSVILGQVNFFDEYEVVFRRWKREFEIKARPK